MTRKTAATVAAAAANLLVPPGDTPLEDDRRCACGDLEADHRVDGPCTRCRRCREFLAATDDEVTQVAAPLEAFAAAPPSRELAEAARLIARQVRRVPPDDRPEALRLAWRLLVGQVD